jgi:hypothetical protein
MNPKLSSAFLAVLFFGQVASGSAQTPNQVFTVLSIGPAGVATTQPDTLTIATPLTNLTRGTVTALRIDRLELSPARLQTSLPLGVDSIRGLATEVFQADFDSRSLVPGQRYNLVVQGTFRIGGRITGVPQRFRLNTSVTMPPRSDGSNTLRKTQVKANSVKGGRYPPQRPRMDQDVNQAAPPVPRTRYVPGTPTATTTDVAPAPVGDPPAITFNANSPVGINNAGSGCGDASSRCAEPSGASGGGVIFVSANFRVAYSTNGGGNFTILDPTTIFPNDAVGFCCDQIIQYAPSIDRFIWLLQGTGYRLAVASPADIQSSNGTAWTYWNLTPGIFGSCTALDYPDLSVGDTALYISWDAMQGGCTSGFQVVRTSLAGIKAAGTITVEFTDPANAPSSMIWGEHLSQNTGDEIFWAGHNGNTKLRVYSLKENSNTYFWRDKGISSWATNAPTSTSPDGVDWLAKNFNGPGGNSFPYNGIIGAARSGNQLWFGWSAGTDNNFKQAHIEIVTLDRNNNFNKIQQVQVWNNSYAFAYPAFSSNACTGEIGMSFEYGGNGNYENHVVGFWGDFVAYITTSSDVGNNRFGDYVTIRRAPRSRTDPGNLFTAFGFGVNKNTPPTTGNRTDVRYVLFGRPTCPSR